MSNEPLHPLDIPEDTTKAGIAGWMLESIAEAPTGPRVAAIVIGP